MFIFSVPQGHCCIIEMFGKPSSVKKSGLNFYIPVLQKPKDVSSLWGDLTNKKGIFIVLSEQITCENGRICTTKDNVNVEVSCTIRWRIVDPVKAVYDVDNLHRALTESVLNEMRSTIGTMALDSVLTGRSALSEKITRAIAPTTSRWGIGLTSVEIQEMATDKDTAAAMRQIMEAERRSRAIQAEAEGESNARIRLAEADKQAEIVRAQGHAEAMNIRAEADKAYLAELAQVVGQQEAVRILLNRQTLEGYETIAKTNNAKVYLPSNLPSSANVGD